MFGRAKTQQASGATAVTADDLAAGTGAAAGTGKGRPTPSRREAEQRNRRPVVAAPRLSPNASKEERRAARRLQRQAAVAERARARSALQTGDERHLPARDQGPARRWVRDHVDARRGPGEYFLPVAIVLILAGLVRGVPVVLLASTVLLYAMVLTVVVDGVLLSRRVKHAVTERFGESAARGTGLYAVGRSLQLRRLRLPRPQVRRGAYPA